MGFGAEMKDFHDALRSMSDVRYRNAARRRIEWELEEPPNTGDSVFDNPIDGGIGTTDAPGSKSGARKYKDVTLGNRGGGAFSQYAYDYYRQKGLGHNQAAAIAGNLQVESGGDPRVFSGARMGDQGTAGFAAQWRLGRLKNLYAFAKSRGNAKPTMQDQFDFVLEEGNPESPYAEAGAVKAFNLMDQAKTVEQATDAFMTHFERPADRSSFKARVAAAGGVTDAGTYDTVDAGGGATKVAEGVTDTGAIPEEGSEEVAGPDTAGTDIDVVAAPDAAPVEAVQVSTSQDPLNTDEYEFAEGGAIPDDTLNYAGAGAVTYQTAPPIRSKFATSYKTPSGSVPHRINIPARDDSWRTWGGNSPSQLKNRAALAAARMPEATTPAPKEEAPATKWGLTYTGPTRGPGYSPLNNQVMEFSNWNDIPQRFRSMMETNPSHWRIGASGATGGRPGETFSYIPGHPSYKFAKGGKVDPRDAEFREWERRYSRPGASQHGSETPRDRAARTMNIRTRNVISTAWPPSRPGGGGQPAAPPSTRGGSKSAARPPGEGPLHVRHPPNPTVGRPTTVRHPPNPTVGRGEGRSTLGELVYRLRASPDFPADPNQPIFGDGKSLLDALFGGEGLPEDQNAPIFPNMNTEPQQSPPDDGASGPGFGSGHLRRLFGYEDGGAIPDDDTEYFARGGRVGRSQHDPGYTTSATGQRSSAIPRTKTAQKVRKPDTKKVSRSGAKKSKQGKPRTASGEARVPIPQPRPSTTDTNMVRPAGGPERVRHPPNAAVGAPTRVRHPPNAAVGTPSRDREHELWPHFDQVTELIPQAPEIKIVFERSGSGAPPGSMGVRMPGVSPPVTGYDVPAGGQWADTAPPEVVDEAPSMPTARDMAWPFDTRPAYARGGAIPDDEGPPYPNWRAEEAGYTTSSADPDVVAHSRARTSGRPAGRAEPATPEDTAPTGQPVEAGAPPPAAPRFGDVRDAARGAVDMGVRGLQRFFGMEPGGAIATPDDDVAHSDGARRFGSGEGAATSEDVAVIDKVTGVDRMGITDPGLQHLARLDRAVNWYLQRGQTEKAEAVAMSLLQYGATKVKQAGTMAAAALSEYQESGDPNDLKNAMGYIKLAHQLIPDGFNIDLDVDPETRQFVVTAIDSEGQAQKHVVDPRAIPGLLQKAIDGSAYWDSMFRIGHPSLAGQRETRAIRAEERAYDEQQEEKKYERGQEDILEREDRAAARKLFEHNLKMDEGSTEGERRRISDQRYYDDWTARFDEAAPEDKQALVDEGLQYRYEHTPNRSRPIDDEAITTTVTAMEDQFGDDIEDVADIARSIGVKNGVLDGVGAANVAAALITDPLDIGRGLSAGTLEVNGNSLVFNPALLPRLSTLRKKYRQQ